MCFIWTTCNGLNNPEHVIICLTQFDFLFQSILICQAVGFCSSCFIYLEAEAQRSLFVLAGRIGHEICFIHMGENKHRCSPKQYSVLPLPDDRGLVDTSSPFIKTHLHKTHPMPCMGMIFVPIFFCVSHKSHYKEVMSPSFWITVSFQHFHVLVY